MFYKKIIFKILAISILFSNCAKIVPLSGGTKDKIPPKVLTAVSTPNLQTNFTKQPISLVFDEWIVLNDAATQVVVSPPLADRPKVTMSGRTVKFEFSEKEILRSNATYTINFGEAVKDLTEGNVAKSLRFVFATGDKLDSLKFSARVIDAENDNPQDNVLVMLYDDFSDSVVRKSRPFYFAKTDKSGIATLENVRAGKFKIFALKDADFNYKLSSEAEEMGFLDNLVNVGTADSMPTIRLFQAQKKLAVTTKDDTRYGVFRFNFNRDLRQNEVAVTGFENGKVISQEIKKDSLLVWYEATENLTTKIVLELGGERFDTLRMRTRTRNEFLKTAKLESRRAADLEINQNPLQPFEMIFNHPIQNMDEKLIKLVDSAENRVNCTFRRDGRRIFVEKAAWREGEKFSLVFPPQSLTDIFGLQNDSLLKQKIRIQPRKELGDLNLMISNFDSTKNYVVQIQGGGGQMIHEATVQKKKGYKTRIEALTPDQFKLIIVEDTNGNGVWDTGNYDQKRQPERIFRKEIDPIRANWEVEAEVDFRSLEKQ
ncbi:MAG: hypothetical protein RL757_342 [Bacteroidota bacterium]|jgi:uncharacterized protein (DUF2141 family)